MFAESDSGLVVQYEFAERFDVVVLSCRMNDLRLAHNPSVVLPTAMSIA